MAGRDGERRFLPGREPIDSYGSGGFRFGDMSHRGSILVLPSGMHAWEAIEGGGLAPELFAPVVDEAADIELLLIGAGRDMAVLPRETRKLLSEAGIPFETMATAAAVRTYNVLVAENRRVAAAFVAVP